MPILDRSLTQPGFAQALHWRGRSGQFYALTAEDLATFMLVPTRLSVVTSGRIVLWVGSANDVIHDAVSRTRFRIALSRATQVFSVPAPTDDVERMTMTWDLETAEPVNGIAAGIAAA